MSNVQKVCFKEAVELAHCAASADQPVLMIGDPGVGKSALAQIVADRLKMPLEVLIGSTLDATDVGGLPTVSVKDGVRRYPIQSIRRATKQPVLLFLDELSTSPWPVQAAMLRLVFERWAGDERLHPETRIILATNPEDQSPGGVPISAPMIGRVAFVRLRPGADEVLNFFLTLGDESGTKLDKALREEAKEFAYTAGVIPDLLQIDIPNECVGGNVPWGSPRSWERAIRLRATLALEGATHDSKLRATAASVGVIQASAYHSIQKIRAQLPSIEEVEKNPETAPIPTEKEHLPGAAIIVPHVADRNYWSAWRFAERLPLELQMICMHQLLPRAEPPLSTPGRDAGVKARIRMLGSRSKSSVGAR